MFVKASGHFNNAHQLLIEPHQENYNDPLVKAMLECHQGLEAIPEGFHWGKHECVYDELLIFLGKTPQATGPLMDYFESKAKSMNPQNRAEFITLVRRVAMVLSYSAYKNC